MVSVSKKEAGICQGQCPPPERKISMLMKDPGSAITHLIAMVLAVISSIPLLLRAVKTSPRCFWSMAIFIVTMTLLYAASTAYHTFRGREKLSLPLRKLDHAMIYIMIAGSYTPICLLVLDRPMGPILLTVIWSIAAIGLVINGFRVAPKWFSSLIYILMGWCCVVALPQIFGHLHGPAFRLLVSGGIIYTIGGVIYALKLPGFNARHRFFGTHEIFHLFVMGGSCCHYLMMLFFIIPSVQGR